MTCSECGSKFGARTRTGRGAARTRYYVCHGVIDGLACRTPKYLRGDRVDALVWSEVEAFMTDPEAFAEALDTDASADGLDADIGQLERDLDRINLENERAAHLFTTGRIDDAMYDKLTSRTTDRMGALTDRLAGLKGQRRASADRAGLFDSVKAWAARIADGIDALDFDGRREIVRLVVEAVEVTGAGAVTVTFRLPTVSVGERVLNVAFTAHPPGPSQS